ncbi:clostripain-related cysteine peptidase [Sphingobacterium sp. BIGb0165]|uniref:clostripain-related cysteine peptidase n=1 Tax=Sphingobacterium sp. BIGb0165 TaxID=2940615 RepID=UPI002166F490|nr:clostripain-related cysteine peptidase [Sphingobacterium sp. BIGb0165]MCS4228657.1 hypothetical protein [Sphingobacterium sp. BIGb0165]
MKLFLLNGLLAFALFSSCNDKEELAVKSGNRAILVYMGANNNLVADAYNSINAMEEGLSDLDADIYVYATLAGTTPKIYKIVGDQGSDIKSRVIKSYEPHNSADPAVMKEILGTMQGYVADRTTGLILWSHATNWLPDAPVKLMSFNNDKGRKTDLKDLESILPTGLDFLMFDACSMGSVEVLYQLRDRARYTIASPTEVLSTSMPYQQVLKHLLNPDLESGVKSAAASYFTFYDQLSGQYRSATIAVINNSHWTELAGEMKKTLIQHPLATIYRDGLQRLDLDEKSLSAEFDFLDFTHQNIASSATADIDRVVAKLVIYKAHTPTFLGKPILKFSGLSCYVPDDRNKWVHPYYKSLQWAKDSGFDSFVTE